MNKKTFASLLLLVALVAVIYSPSTIGLGASINPLTSSTGGLSHFISYLRGAGYRVEVANTSAQEASMLPGASGYVLIGADEPLPPQAQQAVYSAYRSGGLSIVMAEGNTTNAPFIEEYFGGDVTGAAISDPASPFADQMQFYTSMDLGGTTTVAFLDVASPLVISGGTLTPVAYSPPQSVVSGSQAPAREVVAAVAQDQAGGRAFFVTSASPFTNALMLPAGGAPGSPNDTSMVASIARWAFHAGGTVLVDNSLYTPPRPSLSLGLPVGYLALLLLDGVVSAMVSPFGLASSFFSGGTFFGIPGVVFSLVLALLALAFIRRTLKRYFASEKVVKDDQPIPSVERQVVAESKARSDFLTLSRSKSFYLATCAQLYDVIDEVSAMEFSGGVSSLTAQALATRVGEGEAAEAMKFLAELTRLNDYATGKRRFMLPPILGWKRRVAALTAQAESFLNALGMSMKGEGGPKQLEYALRR
jgi:hypothetical protein